MSKEREYGPEIGGYWKTRAERAEAQVAAFEAEMDRVRADAAADWQRFGDPEKLIERAERAETVAEENWRAFRQEQEERKWAEVEANNALRAYHNAEDRWGDTLLDERALADELAENLKAEGLFAAPALAKWEKARE